MKVALVGKMRSGKSSFARQIQSAHPERHDIYSFGSRVKIITTEMLNVFAKHQGYPGMNYDISDLERYKKMHPEIRRFIQTVATDLGRYWWSKEAWVNCLFQDINGKENVIVDDVRYPNEAEALRKAGFILVRVTRNEAKRIEQVYNEMQDNHAGYTEDEFFQMVNEVLFHESELVGDAIDCDIEIPSLSLAYLKDAAETFFKGTSTTKATREYYEMYKGDKDFAVDFGGE